MALNTYKILIVEDDRGLNRGIALALKEETVEFLSALTLAQAQEIWKNNAVDMVLLDVNLPDCCDETKRICHDGSNRYDEEAASSYADSGGALLCGNYNTGSACLWKFVFIYSSPCSVGRHMVYEI